jgi:hypothetical protein
MFNHLNPVFDRRGCRMPQKKRLQSLKNSLAWPRFSRWFLAVAWLALFGILGSRGDSSQESYSADRAATMMTQYSEHMSQPKPFLVRTGKDWESRQEELRARMLKDMHLDPLPESIPLDPHYSEAIQHPWCTIHKVAFQLWPGVYSRGLLYMPQELAEKPAPAVLCVHGHTDDGYADADEQRRYLMFAKLGYVTFVTPQDHHDDILRGYSHQTYMVWNNMRGLDFLQSLPEVDPNRIGVNGLSGGGLQSQMLVALDRRLKAATIAGMTCDYREKLFTYRHHCECNHWPDAMTYTDQPEISALGFPAAVQYLTMDDWTKHFAADDFPTIQLIYRDNGYPDRTECVYWPTPHEYDRVKRERTYWWMEKWVRGSAAATIPSEPEKIEIISPPKTLLNLKVAVPGERTYEDYISSIFRRDDRIGDGISGWEDYRARMTEALRRLLGESQVLPAEGEPSSRSVEPAWAGGRKIDEIAVPSEDGILIPAIVIYPPSNKKTVAVEVYLSEEGRSAAEKNPGSYLARARRGAVVVLPDLRFSGDYAARQLAGRLRPDLFQFKQAYPLRMPADRPALVSNLAAAWDRNGIIWGRPVPGMMAHDLRSVIDFLANQPGLRDAGVHLWTKETSALALTALFAACLELRIKSIDADFLGHRFEKAGLWKDDLTALPTVSRILCYGDIPQWAALLADRRLTLRHVSLSGGERRSLEEAFARLGNGKGLKLID